MFVPAIDLNTVRSALGHTHTAMNTGVTSDYIGPYARYFHSKRAGARPVHGREPRMAPPEVNVAAIVRAPVTAEEMRAVAEPDDDQDGPNSSAWKDTNQRLRARVRYERRLRLRNEIISLPLPISTKPRPSPLPSSFGTLDQGTLGRGIQSANGSVRPGAVESAGSPFPTPPRCVSPGDTSSTGQSLSTSHKRSATAASPYYLSPSAWRTPLTDRSKNIPTSIEPPAKKRKMSSELSSAFSSLYSMLTTAPDQNIH